MSQEKATGSLGEGFSEPAGRAIKTKEVATDYSLESPKLSRPRRRLDPRIGALKKLDSVEQRLTAARAAGDDVAWGRYYQSWLKLHALAFSYGRWAKGAGR